MSYTPPTYVDTKSQAILALASTIADEDKTALGDGSVNKALDVLADVLAETDVQVPQTNAGAILALAQYASGMIKPEGKISITENGEGIDVAQYATADVSVSGGGGDFTTAQVTVVTSGSTTIAVLEYFSVCTTGEFQGLEFAAGQPMTQNLYFDVILYKGASLLNVAEGASFSIVSTSGAIQQMDVGAYMITGDCTITVGDN